MPSANTLRTKCAVEDTSSPLLFRRAGSSGPTCRVPAPGGRPGQLDWLGYPGAAVPGRLLWSRSARVSCPAGIAPQLLFEAGVAKVSGKPRGGDTAAAWTTR